MSKRGCGMLLVPDTVDSCLNKPVRSGRQAVEIDVIHEPADVAVPYKQKSLVI